MSLRHDTASEQTLDDGGLYYKVLEGPDSNARRVGGEGGYHLDLAFCGFSV